MDIKICNGSHSEAYKEGTKILVSAREASYCFDSEVKYICENGNEVCIVKRRPNPYFRHMPNNDWHEYIQNCFVARGKVYDIQCKKEVVIGNHRADICIENKEKEYKIIVEVQHTFEYAETKRAIKERTVFYTQKGYSIIWFIDGSDFTVVNISEDINDPRYFISEPHGNQKIYDLFNGSGLSKFYLYKKIDDTEYVFEIHIDSIKSGMIECNHHNYEDDVKEFIDKVIKNKINFTTVNNPPINVETSMLIIKQRGAGTGKTYESVQLLDSEETEWVDTYVCFSKLHSNKTIVREEIKKQIERGDLQGKIINDNSTQNQYCIQYKNNGKIKTLIIGTIDSFVWAMKNYIEELKKGSKPFIEMAKQLKDEIQKKLLEVNRVYTSYAGSTTWFNKKTCFIIDEAQDLEYEYFEFLYSFMCFTGISCYFIGDKLQSIYHPHNIVTNLLDKKEDYFRGINIKFIKDMAENIGRRFENKTIVEGINKLIDFKKLGLKETIYDERHSKNNNKINKEPGFITISLPKQDILEYVMREYKSIVEEYNYNPNDFLLIFPSIDTDMEFASTFKTKIEEFWSKKYSRNGQYSILHSAKTYGSIDLTTSIDKTRLVTIHSSKGDGRNIVFTIGINEKWLHCFKSSKPGDIIYESLFYVAISRPKQRIYLIHTGEKGDIFNRMKQAGDLKLDLSYISGYIPFSDTIQWMEGNTEFSDKVNHRILDSIENKITPISSTLDFNHHLIRYSMLRCMEVQFFSSDSEDDTSLKRLYHQIKPLLYYRPERYNSKEYYNMLRIGDNKQKRYKDSKVLPLLQSKNKLRIELDDIEKTINQINREYWGKNKRSNLPFDPNKLLKIIFSPNDNIKETIEKMVVFTHVFELENFKPVMTLENVITIIHNLKSTNSEQVNLFYGEVVKMKEKFEEIKGLVGNRSRFNINYILPYKQSNTQNFEMRTNVTISYNENETVIYLLKPSACDLSSYDLSTEIEGINMFIENLQEDKEEKGVSKRYRFTRPKRKFCTIYNGGYIIFTEKVETIPNTYYETLRTNMKEYYTKFSTELYKYYRQSIIERKNNMEEYKRIPACIKKFMTSSYEDVVLDGDSPLEYNRFYKKYINRVEQAINAFVNPTPRKD